MARKSFIWGAAALAGAAVLLYFFFSPPAYRCRECNVVLISIDTLRADRLGCYGYAPPTSPQLDSFSREAVLFQNTIAQAPSTAPSHASILTGVIPSVHGNFAAKKTAISSAVPTLAEILKTHGFRTASFNGGAQLNKQFGFDRGFEIYQSYGRTDYENEKFVDRIEEGLNWLKSLAGQKFFLFLHTYDSHHPYAPAPEQGELFRNGYDGPLPAFIDGKLLRDVNWKRKTIGAADRRYISDLYDAEIRGWDEALPRLTDFLRATGLYDRTLIIFTSDHGEEFDEHGWIGWHGHTLFDELLKVPLLIKFPNQLFAGRRISEQVRSIDILPTVLDVLGIDPPRHLQGAGLLPVVFGKEQTVRYAYSQRDLAGSRIPTAIRTPEWKVYKKALFHLSSDPAEKQDVRARYPEVDRELRDKIAAVLKVQPPAGIAASLDSATVEQLRTLGYLD